MKYMKELKKKLHELHALMVIFSFFVTTSGIADVEFIISFWK